MSSTLSNRIDEREGLWNGSPVGAVTQIQVPAERITQLDGILFDFDAADYRPENTLFPPDSDPRNFHEKIRPVLDRHPLACKGEVRASGSGLHAIIQLVPPVSLETAAAQKYWASIVRAVQCSLPTDPNAPGITATTRAVGSVNSKNGAVVELLRQGEPVSPEQVIAFVERVAKGPFKEVATILLGGTRIQPCPVCQKENSRLDVLDYVGMCYAGCGKVSLTKIVDAVFLTAADEHKDETKPNNESRKDKIKNSKERKNTTKNTKKANASKGRKRPAMKPSRTRKGKTK